MCYTKQTGNDTHTEHGTGTLRTIGKERCNIVARQQLPLIKAFSFQLATIDHKIDQRGDQMARHKAGAGDPPKEMALANVPKMAM